MIISRAIQRFTGRFSSLPEIVSGLRPTEPRISFPVSSLVAYAHRMATKPSASDVKRPRPRVLTRSTVLPAAGIGVITLILAMQEKASFPIALVVGVAVALVVVGMIALKRGFYGD
jgi:hypothetical protein